MDSAELINEAIDTMAYQPAVFTAEDVAAYADLEGANNAIKIALRRRCTNRDILLLDRLRGSAKFDACYLGTRVVEQWWINRTARWAKAGVQYLTPVQLASEMSLSLDTHRWTDVPTGVLAIGRQWAMVADSYEEGILVLPWAIVLSANQHCLKWFSQSIEYIRSLFSSGALPAGPESVITDVAGEVLGTITNREADVIRGRLGLETGYPATLERLGNIHGVTRERIRQVESKAWRKLWHQSRQRRLWAAFAVDFIQSGGSLLIQESAMTPHRRFLHRGIELKTVHVPEITLHLIGPEDVINDFRHSLRTGDTYPFGEFDTSRIPVVHAIPFLPKNDRVLIREALEEYFAGWVTRTRPLMLRESLRSLGRAAHYQEIAEECHRLFPERQTSVRSWHAALSDLASPEKERFGIVWIGRKGMYGLKEHGYSRPDMDLFDGVARIVEAMFAKTQHPVSEEIVMAELSKHRRELRLNSVKMALSFNDNLKAINGGFVPKKFSPSEALDSERPQYDIDAAFAAFIAHDDDRD